MLDSVLGLPAHPLIVHATVVMVPLAAFMVVAAALSARFRHWSRYATPAAALIAVVLVPLASSSGESFEGDVQRTALVREHAELGDTLLPLMLAVTVLAVAMFWLDRRSGGAAPLRERSSRGPLLFRMVAVLAVVASLGTLVQVGRIGHSGAKAVWSETTSSGGAADGAHGG